MRRSIEYYFSLQSPWAYLGHAAFEKVVSDYDCEVIYKPVVLTELFSETGGLPLAKRHPVRQRYRLMELQRWRDKRGLALNLKPRHWPFNATLADQLVIAIVADGRDPDPFLRRAFAAIWEFERDLADPGTLRSLAEEAGLPGAALIEAARSDACAAIYRSNHADAVTAGVFGSPTYVLDGEIFWGQDRVELLADALRSQRKAYHAEP
ncbi:MAG: 2-hydroxychromene-2-carboxylate isomerase [Xanthobacteraceae bacterium]